MEQGLFLYILSVTFENLQNFLLVIKTISRVGLMVKKIESKFKK